MTRSKLRNMYARNLLLSTIDWYVCQNINTKWQAKNGPIVQDNHIIHQLQWALEHKDRTHKVWEGVIWSDECYVERSDSEQQIWVLWQPPEKLFKDCCAPKWKVKGISFMVWSCFWGRNCGTFCRLVPNWSTRVSMSSFLSIFFFQLLNMSMTP